MRHLPALLSALTLVGCATKPHVPEQAVSERPVCTNGILALYFMEDAAALAARLARGLEWPARAIAECPGATFKVIGLPQPSAATLQGQRATSLVKALRAFGVPQPTFELGDGNDQARPVLEILARPDQ